MNCFLWLQLLYFAPLSVAARSSLTIGYDRPGSSARRSGAIARVAGFS
jgi:hypothetical protein